MLLTAQPDALLHVELDFAFVNLPGTKIWKPMLSGILRLTIHI